jgi:hypothetical protein
MTSTNNKKKKPTLLYKLVYDNLSDKEKQDDYLINPSKYIHQIVLNYGIYTIPTIDITLDNSLFINQDLYTYTPKLILYFKETNKNYECNITCLSKNDNKIAGILIKKDVYYNRASVILKNSLKESLLQLNIRNNINGLTDVIRKDRPYQIINKTALEGFRELASTSENLWCIEPFDNIKFIDITNIKNNKFSDNISSIPLGIGTIRSNINYSKLTDTNYSEDDSVYKITDTIGTNIRYGKYNLPLTKVATNTIVNNTDGNNLNIDQYFNNIINRYTITSNYIDTITFIDNVNLHNIGDIMVFDYNSNKTYYIIWNIIIVISNSISSEESTVNYTYTCRRLLYDLLPRESNKNT